YAQLVKTTTQLNKPGTQFAEMASVHALTDITGFGLAGHTLELARGAGLTAEIRWSGVPLLDGVATMAADGFVTGASGRNWAGYGSEVTLDPALPAVARDLLSDPQTSGGLLVSCDPALADDVLRIFRDGGFDQAAVIGRMTSGPAGLIVRA
ncbi:MAG TPA: AIR synthase-related protein, partial [Albitalea sp.]|nr:AIR synthase-related protein [Albitalea sp.]